MMTKHHVLGGILALLGLAACEKESPAVPSGSEIAATSEIPAAPPAATPVAEEFEIDVEEPAPEELEPPTTPGEKLDHALQKTGQALQVAGERTEQGVGVAAEKTEQGLRRALESAGKGLKKAGEAIEGAGDPVEEPR